VTGKARIVKSALAATEIQLEQGEILVAPVTDAGWTPLFVSAGGVVVETGGMLSHAATVAREYGLPAVVNIEGATSIIPEGSMLSIDGATGKVDINF
jgi:pyruvate,water dikinase